MVLLTQPLGTLLASDKDGKSLWSLMGKNVDCRFLIVAHQMVAGPARSEQHLRSSVALRLLSCLTRSSRMPSCGQCTWLCHPQANLLSVAAQALRPPLYGGWGNRCGYEHSLGCGSAPDTVYLGWEVLP
ncbi:hypothetical protein FQN60_003345 [Etheostoma spectabile]|uniref:Uncharacterized protein n=1 Tax=Etheostoma spectabile TaxID=54343 RepID=A0A5J5CIV8_9PERO|nr:hypothetical protein FQN60_003345 [Etheostoma spectabile]